MQINKTDTHGRMEVPKLQQRALGKAATARIVQCLLPKERAIEKQPYSAVHGGVKEDSQLLAK